MSKKQSRSWYTLAVVVIVTIIATYHADANGLRFSGRATVESQLSGLDRTSTNADTQRFLYQDGLNPVAELDAAGNVVSRFIYGDDGHVPSLMERGGATYRLISDHLGSIRLVVNVSTGDVVQRLDYDSFGNVTLDTNPGFQPFGYTGGLYDPATGLVRLGARDYDSTTGRWTATDPIGFNGNQVNLYTYVNGDPVNSVDPSGLEEAGGADSGSGAGWGGFPAHAPAGVPPADFEYDAYEYRLIAERIARGSTNSYDYQRLRELRSKYQITAPLPTFTNTSAPACLPPPKVKVPAPNLPIQRDVNKLITD